MSSENDLVIVQQVLTGLLQPDNNTRKQAEMKLQEMMQNKEPLTIILSKLLTTNNQNEVLIYAAIILRKIYTVKDDQISNNDWSKLSQNAKTETKQNLLQSLTQNKDPKLKKKICDAICNIYVCISENEEKWEELLRYIISGLNLELNEANLSQIEVSLYLLAGVYFTAYDEMNEGIPTYIKCFQMYFKSNSLSLKSKTVKCINELLCSSMSKKETKKFREFMISILETTLHCLNANDNENLRICLESLNDLANCEPKILRKSFGDIFILMGKVIQSNDIDDELHKVSFEILIRLITGMPKVIEKDEEKLNLLIQSIFKYAMQIDNNIDEDWMTPALEKYISDEFIPEEKLDEAANLLTRLFDALPDQTDLLLKLTSNNILELLRHSEQDWKYKYIAYIVIAEIVSYVDNIDKIKDLIETILNDVHSPQIKVQYACLYCIAEIAEEHNPDFQNNYHQRVIPNLLEILASTKVLRIKLEVCDALDCYVQHMTDSNAATYMEKAFEVLFTLFLKDFKESPSCLKQIILTVIDDFIDASNECFKKYAERCLNILLQALNGLLQANDKYLLGLLLETISSMIPICPELFKPKLLPLAETLAKIQSNQKSFKDNIAENIYSTWEKILPHLMQGHKDTVPMIIDSLLTLLKNPPEMSVASNPNEKIDIESFFKDDEKTEKKEKVTLETSETEEYSTFLETLNLFLENAPEYAVKYSNVLHPMVLTLLKYPNFDIQGESSKVFIWIIKGLALGDQALLHSSAKTYISDVIGQLEKEKEFSLVIDLLDTVKDIIEKTGMFLVSAEINALSMKILNVFNNVEKARIALLNQKAETEKEIENDKKTGDNKIYSDDEDSGSDEEALDDIKDKIEELEEVQTTFSEFFGTLFKTHKAQTMQLVEMLLKEYLPKYLSEQSSTFEKKLGVLIIDDMAEFLTQSLLNNIWLDIKNILIKYVEDKDYTLRNAAVYGIGVYAQHTSNNFEAVMKDLIDALKRSLTFPKDAKAIDKENMKFSKDNSVSALGKIIKYHGNELNDLNALIQLWVDSLPIVSDSEEGVIMNKFLMEIIEKSPFLVLGENYRNLGHIVQVLVKGLDTSFCDDETNAKIKDFIQKIKADQTMSLHMNNSFEQMKEGKNKNKIKALFYQ